MKPSTGSELRLHVGSGQNAVAGWENLDRSLNVRLSKAPALRRALVRARVLTEAHGQAHFPPEVIRADALKGLPYADRTVRYIFSSHMIEHVSRWQGLDLLRECRRVLMPGGVVRITTPDLRLRVQDYVEGRATSGPTPADTLMQELRMFREEPGSAVQRFVRRVISAEAHQWWYDEESLKELFRDADFPDPVAHEFREGDVPDLDRLELHRESIHIEATLPG